MPEILRKRVRVMPPGTVNPAWRKVNIRGKSWPHTPPWILSTAVEYAASPAGQIETVIDSGGWLPGLKEVFVDGYVPGGWTLPLNVTLDFKMGKYSVNGTMLPLAQILDPASRWGVLPPAALVMNVGLLYPAGAKFAFVPTLAHVLVYLGMNAKINYSVTALGDLSLCFVDDTLRSFCTADGSHSPTHSCRYIGPAGLVVVHSANTPTTGAHRFDVSMTTTYGRIRNDMAQWTELNHQKAAPDAMLVVGSIAGPLTITRMVLDSMPAGPATLPTLPINLPDD